jgi:bifunctional non-homologous end joining protein LigD
VGHLPALASTSKRSIDAPFEAFPAKLLPMTAQLARAPFRAPGWLFEPKLDGYGMLAFLHGGELRLMSRRGIAYTRQFPSIVAGLQTQTDADCIFDGEIVAFGADGKPSFNALQNRAGAASDAEISAAERRTPTVFFCFDLLHHAGRNLRGLPYVERRALLHALVRPTAHVQLVHAEEDGNALYAAALDAGFEGVVAKRKTSIYRAGQRSPDWLKVKQTSSAEFLIGGFSRGKGERERFGSLVAGYRDDAGKLRYAGNVGVGYDQATIDDLLARLETLVVARSPFAEKVPLRAGTTWVRPELVAEVAFAHWTEGARLRAPVFLRLRDDIDPRSIRRRPDAAHAAHAADPPDAPDAHGEATAPPGCDARRATPTRSPAERRAAADREAGSRISPDPGDVRRLLGSLERPLPSLEVGGHAIRLTHLDRVYWPEDRERGQAAISKFDLIRYLLTMSPLILPHVHDRPLTLFRWPGGIQGRRMLQKHPESALPAFVETTTIFSETKGTDDEYLLCNNLATLVWLAEIGALEIHVWHSRIGAAGAAAARSRSSGSAADLANSAVNFPDYMLFDLDPYIDSGSERSRGDPEPSAEGFEAARRVAFWLKHVLDGMSLQCCVKTSGKTGLHVVVPMTPTLRYDAVRRMAQTICRHLSSRHPETITTEWDTRKRKGKVFMDFNMNVRGKSLIAPYCPRGLPGAPVSMPLTWRELAHAEPMQYRIGTLMRDGKRGDPWSAVLDHPQSLETVLSTMRDGQPSEVKTT